MTTTIQQYVKNAQLFAARRSTLPLAKCVAMNGNIRATDIYEAHYTADTETPYDGCYERDTIPALLSGAQVKPLCPVHEFIAAPAFDGQLFAVVDRKQFIGQLTALLLCVSDDATMYNINGICFELNTGLMVSTDGHRLHTEQLRIHEQHESTPETNAIVPASSLKALLKCLKASKASEVSISFDKTFALFAWGIETLQVRLVDGRYPDWRQVVPPAGVHTALYRKADLLAAVKRLMLVYPKAERHKGIRFDGACLTATSTEAKDSVELEAQRYADSVPACQLDARYLIDACAQLEGDLIDIHFPAVDEKKKCVSGPVRVFGANQNYRAYTVIMPMCFE